MIDTPLTTTVAAKPASEQSSVRIGFNATLLEVKTYDCNNGQCGTLGQHKIDNQPLYVRDGITTMVILQLPNNTTVDAVVPTTSGITMEQLRALTGKEVVCEVDGTAAQDHREDLTSVRNSSTHAPAVLVAIEELSR